MLEKLSSCNYLWCIEHLIMLIVHVCSEWLQQKCTFQQKVSHTHTSCYVVIVLTCKVPFLFMSELAYATQRTPHTQWILVTASVHVK